MMRRVLGLVLLFVVSCAACQSTEPDGAPSADGRVQTTGGAHDAEPSEAHADAANGADADSGSDAAMTEEKCPPECFRAFTCAPACGAPSFNNGCCPCPAGTIDTITCAKRANAGHCTVPCTGAAPSLELVQACEMISTERACKAYKADAFPYACRWVTPETAPCPPLP